MTEEEIEKKVEELVKATLEKKDLDAKIKLLKAEIKEYADIENINDKIWQVDNGYVEILTETKYKLSDVPAEITVSPEVAAIDVAEKAFSTKVTLSKEGKKLFKAKHPAIVKLMIPNIKKQVKIQT